MNTKLGYIALFITSALAGVSAGLATSADAWTVNAHASACLTFGGTPIFSSSGIQNDGAATMTLLCPVHDQTGQLKSSTTQVLMAVTDDTSSDAVLAIACSVSVIGRGGICGPFANSGVTFVGDAFLTVPTAGVWSAGALATHGYLAVFLPAKQGSGRTGLQGFSQTGT